MCLKKADALEEGKHSLVSASSLTPGQELSGYVKDIMPYGVFIDVGANRKGLLHITKVAQHYDTYIDKEEGLKRIGLKQGTPINVVVSRNEKKMLEFDFPLAVGGNTLEKADTSTGAVSTGYENTSDEEAAAWAAYGNNQSDQYDVSEEEAAMWALYADYNTYDETDDDIDDEPDEDREIEDALGIGSW